ncbi:serine hydrolase domain-containing protein [Micromonospora parathelypteridis]|uniref:CubicO group peptidase (Beta-lactamase class C family) n=1 Tax=Micromonospora parathelypteridis TaxID=1839617 RepID=A0A840VVK1_9ACTN|nr:serine hydrolase domain-containing protein [Micromonospora parathelypteridis]MBB5481353.1 CubicO group peptidase (beta-lactamase class C family) [Micromonospora parathelypteridis]GGO18924.1 FmtA-like protein [Micromonospora parathelypteridis]
MFTRVTRTLLASVVALGAVTAVPGAAQAAPATGYEAFFDNLVPAQLAKYRIPGAAVVVVDGQHPLFARGYGLADVDTRVPVSPDRTGFFIASNAKLWTTTAVMQLVEQGKLDLNTDVNRYLTAFKIRDSYPGQPVTLAHLLTHTSGFVDEIVGAAVRDPADAQPLADYLAEHQPERVRRPGTLASYDNYGFTLAGYLVQVVSGEPFDRYVATHLLQPLGMSGSTASQPPTAAVNATLAQGYRPQDDRQVRVQGQYGPMVPTGAGVVSTATDMGRFLSDQLRTSTSPIQPQLLDPTALRQMQTRQFSHDPQLPGMAFGWQEHPRDGQLVLAKDGDVPGFHSNAALLPDKGIGIFVVYNGDGVDGTASWAGKEVVDEFVGSFFPGAATTGGNAVAAGQDPEVAGSLNQYEGDYRVTRTAEDLTKAAALMSSVSVEVGPDNTLTTRGPLSPDPDKVTQHWTPIGPRLFQERGGQDQLGFRVDGDGQIAALFDTSNPTIAYQRLAWWQSPTLHQVLLVGALTVLLVTLLYYPIAVLVRLLRRRSPAAGTRWSTTARLAAWITAALATAFTAGLAVLFSDGNRLQESILLGKSPVVITVLAMSTTAVVTAAATITGTVAAWRRGWWTLPGRLHHTAVSLAAVVFLGVVSIYHLTLA